MAIILKRIGVLFYAVLFSGHLPRRQHFGARAVLSLMLLLVTTGLFSYLEAKERGGVPLDLLWLALCSLALCLSYTARPVLYIFWSLVPIGVFGWAQSLYHVVFSRWMLPFGIRYVVAVAIYLAVGAFGYRLLVWRGTEGRKKKGLGKGLFLVVVALLMSLFAMVNTQTPSSLLPWQLDLFRSLLSLLALLMLYIYKIEYHLRDDYEILSELLEKDKIRYEVSKEYTELINMKFHDIKHQIGKLRRTEKVDPAYLDRLESAIRQYDSELHTGNEALDIILTEKNRICAEKNIEATIIADGRALSFISAADIYSIFGNILDNAIEASEKLQEDDMKQISLVAAEDSGVIRIRVQNYFSETPKQDGDSFHTTKKDTDAHGFGIKSVKYIVEKYGGVVTTEISGSTFLLNILLPQSE